MNNLTIYTKAYCPYCKNAKTLLRSRGFVFTEIDIERSHAKQKEMIKRSQRHTVPQIFAGDTHIGGFADLVARFKEYDEWGDAA
nr:glutaredoxin 3 [Marinagarivorans algicola]